MSSGLTSRRDYYIKNRGDFDRAKLPVRPVIVTGDLGGAEQTMQLVAADGSVPQVTTCSARVINDV